jgi:apolipoprotein D and lipocalin family protein
LDAVVRASSETDILVPRPGHVRTKTCAADFRQHRQQKETDMRKTLAILGSAAVATASGAAAQGTGDAVDVDPEAYEGLWYEVARTPAPFQEQCAGGATAFYELIDDETIRVLNRCDVPGGEVSSVDGTAEVVGSDFGRLSVDFPGSPDDAAVNYRVEALGPVEDGFYAWTAVTGGDREIGWILARDPDLGDEARAEAEAALEGAGIDLARLEDTDQPPENYDAAER